MGRWWQKWSLSYSHPYVVNLNPKTLIGNILTLTQGTHDFNAILSREFSWLTLRSMVASLRSLLPQFLGGTDEPVKEFVPSLAEDDGFIPEYSKYISPPRATTVAPQRHNVITSRRCSCCSRAGPPTDTRRGRSRVMNDNHLPPPAEHSTYISPPRVTTVAPRRHNVITSRSCCSRAPGPPADTRRGRSRVMSDNHLPPPAYTPVPTQVMIHAIPGQTLNIVTSSTTGLIVNPY